MTRRETVDMGGVPISYLTAGKGGPLVLMLHGTYWSRVWQPVIEGIASAGPGETGGSERRRSQQAQRISARVGELIEVGTGGALIPVR